MYLPQVGFDEKYFPYREIEGYMNPLVAVFFEKPSRMLIFFIFCPNLTKTIF